MQVLVTVYDYNTLGFGRTLRPEKKVKVSLINGDKSMVVWNHSTSSGFTTYSVDNIEKAANKFADELRELCK